MRYRPLVFVAAFVLAPLIGLLAAEGAFCFTAQDVPAAEMPVINASPGTASNSTPGPASSPRELQPSEASTPAPQEHTSEAAPQDDTSVGDSIEKGTDSTGLETEQEGSTSEFQPAAEATLSPPPLDTGNLTVGPELGGESLDPEITKAVAPAMAASLRLTESARKLLVNGQVDDAMRDLARAVSLDSSDAFAYYYLGRAYLTRKDYTQALTFFRRAELGFNGRPDWTAEALSYEGICDEELGKTTDAVRAYKRALAASPNNFHARVGYGRLASAAGSVENVDTPPPGSDLAIPAPEAPDEYAPSEPPPPSASAPSP